MLRSAIFWLASSSVVFSIKLPPLCPFAGNKTDVWLNLEKGLDLGPPGDAVTIIVQMLFINFYDIDERDGTIWADIMYMRAWNDQRANLKCTHPSLYLRFDQRSRLWQPDVTLSALAVGNNNVPYSSDILGVSTGWSVKN